MSTFNKKTLMMKEFAETLETVKYNILNEDFDENEIDIAINEIKPEIIDILEN